MKMVREWRKKKRLRPLLAAVVLAFSLAVPTFAAGPSGPALDAETADQGKDSATGPAAESWQEDPSTQPAQPEPGGQTAQPEQGEPPAQPGQEELPVQPELGDQPIQNGIPEGMVMSGGRLLDPSKPMIALTFDDGPYAPVGNRIMDMLELYNGRSTFFVVGDRVAGYATEIRRMYDNGHEVANHTYQHKYLTKLSASEIRSQIELCNQAVAAVTGESPELVRLPGGLKNSTVLGNVYYPIIMWNIDTLDWKTRNASKTVAAVLGKVKDGDIVLMHELYPATADAADVLIPALSQQGYQLVTVSELAMFRGGVQPGQIYSQFRP